MKKIIVCISLTLIFIMSATVSFLVNDLGSSRHWMINNRPKIMENFGHPDKGKKERIPQGPKDGFYPKENNRHPMKKQAPTDGPTNENPPSSADTSSNP